MNLAKDSVCPLFHDLFKPPVKLPFGNGGPLPYKFEPIQVPVLPIGFGSGEILHEIGLEVALEPPKTFLGAQVDIGVEDLYGKELHFLVGQMEEVHMELGDILQVFHLGEHPLPDQIAEHIDFLLRHFGPIPLYFRPLLCRNGLGGQKIDEFRLQFLQLFLGQTFVLHGSNIERRGLVPMGSKSKKAMCSMAPSVSYSDHRTVMPPGPLQREIPKPLPCAI